MPATATVLAFILITSIFVGGVNNNSALISYAAGEQLPQQQGSCPDGSQPDSSGNCPSTQPQQPQQQPAPGCLLSFMDNYLHYAWTKHEISWGIDGYNNDLLTIT